MKEYYIDDDGIKIHAKLEMPKGVDKCPLVIVVHGFTGDMEEEHITGAADAIVESGYAALRVEMYGHGKSGGEFRNHTLYKWIGNMLAVIDHVKTLDFVTDIYICGHSQGGLLVMLIAGMCPDILRGVIPMSPAWMIPECTRLGELLGDRMDPKHIPDEFYQNGDNLLSGNYIRVAQTIHVEEQIERYDGPVLIIHGTDDETVPFEYGKKAAEMYKNAKLVPVEGDDHCFNFHLDAVKDAIKDYLLSVVQ